jgi:hypothetical protein
MADLLPNAETVVVSYLKAIDVIGNNVATDLPGPDTNGNYPWQDTGFIRVGAVFEDINFYTTVRETVATIECFAFTPNASKPPYPKANLIAEKVVNSTLPNQHFNVLKGKLELPSRYYPVSILEATIATGPRRDFRLVNDNRAIYMVDLRLVWVALPTS